MKRKHAFTIISEGLTTELSRDLGIPKCIPAKHLRPGLGMSKDIPLSAEETKKELSPNLSALQQELQKIQIKPKYIKINLKK